MSHEETTDAGKFLRSLLLLGTIANATQPKIVKQRIVPLKPSGLAPELQAARQRFISAYEGGKGDKIKDGLDLCKKYTVSMVETAYEYIRGTQDILPSSFAEWRWYWQRASEAISHGTSLDAACNPLIWTMHDEKFSTDDPEITKRVMPFVTSHRDRDAERSVLQVSVYRQFNSIASVMNQECYSKYEKHPNVYGTAITVADKEFYTMVREAYVWRKTFDIHTVQVRFLKAIINHDLRTAHKVARKSGQF